MIVPYNVIDSLMEVDWVKAMQDELNEFERHRVWTLVPKPQGKTIIGTRWIFRNNMDEDGIVIRNNERLVTQGFCQVEGLDYDETFALVARLEAILLFLAFSSFKNFKVYQMDVKTTVLHGDLQKEVFLKQPPGLQVKQLIDGIIVFQAKCLTNILKKFCFSDSKPTKTAMTSSTFIFVDPTDADVNGTLY
ncbi:uncharacterized mitochondrial protein AtMg00820-like [Lactuca sativa]|uniref:uncharacterized mitochondrial protein AtMg00820-like n=1 Tax=Lactuca sativa TaxID=4236 RepID=UPI000CD8E142|nr:uncharacterized mitochondrial protein AtMg00820-like [Lactuca sativa]